MYAPIALFVYNRPNHVKQTIEALANNLLASQSHLIIFSDGPRSNDVEESVTDIRKYIRNIKGFANVEIVERSNNLGLADSIISGVTDVCKKYGRVIVLEDDLLTSPTFLTFMNHALDYYACYSRVQSISGHTPTLCDVSLKNASNVFFHYRTSSWGWATWQDRWQHAQWDANKYLPIDTDSTRRHLFDRGGDDLRLMLKEFLEGKNNSWLIRWYYNAYLQGSLTLYPRYSYVDNIGHDGLGTHSKVPLKRFRSDLSQAASNWYFYLPIYADQRFHRAMFSFWSAPAYHRIPFFRPLIRIAKRIFPNFHIRK